MNEKLSGLRKIMSRRGLEGIIVSSPKDIQYLLEKLSFLEGEAILLVHKKGVFALARSLYESAFKEKASFVDMEPCDQGKEARIVAAAKKLKLKEVVFDRCAERYAAGKVYERVGFKAAPSLISEIRVVKTNGELQNMKRAASIARAAFAHIRKSIRVGVSEREIARELEDFMKSKGAQGVSFDSIVAFGAASADPHYYNPGSDRAKLKNNMPVILDFGCVYNGYCSDMTRSFWFGGKPDAEYVKILKLVKAAYGEVVKKARAGMSGAQIDALARDLIKSAGYGDNFTHRTGHGIGMEIHEQADLSEINKNKILNGYCFSVEPGVYLAGKFGARWEDCYYMTSKGIKII